MLIAIPRLPALASADQVQGFWRSNEDLMKAVITSASVGYLFLMGFVGGLVARLRRADPDGALPWVAFGSLVMFTTALNVAIGLDIAAGLLLDAAPVGTYMLHTAGFILAAPAALLGTAFFVAVAALTFETRALPLITGWVAVAGAVLNVGALGGIFTLEGPLNSGNGSVAGIAGPVGVLVLWVLLVSVAWLRDGIGETIEDTSARVS
jgi:hypothetical protein